ncbi:MAG: hypothetical protein AAGB11_13240 [Pseudomonadota bacterium]
MTIPMEANAIRVSMGALATAFASRAHMGYLAVAGRLDLFGKIRSVLDVCGHVGTSIWAVDPPLRIAERVRWIVCETAPMAAAGERRTCAERLFRSRSFVDDLATPEGVIFLASGSSQHYDGKFQDLLSAIRQRPRHVPLNRAPVQDAASIVTPEWLCAASVLDQICDRKAFARSVAAAGWKFSATESFRLDPIVLAPAHTWVQA